METKSSGWVSTEGRTGWYGSDVAAYMIEERLGPFGYVHQRHIWKRNDGSVTEDEWIQTARRYWRSTPVPFPD